MMELFYYLEDETKVIYYTSTQVLDRQDLIFLGSSENPNPKKAAAGFTHKLDRRRGFKVRKLP